MGGAGSITLNPNEVVLFKIGIDGVGNIHEETQHQGLLIYPNPGSDQLFLSANVLVDEVEVYNLQGALVMDAKLSQNQGSIDVSDLESGVYVVRAVDSNLLATKFIKR